MLIADEDTSPEVASHPHPEYTLTPLTSFPEDATVRIWRQLPGRVTAEKGEEVHVGELFPTTGDYLLISFADQSPSNWEELKRELAVGRELGLATLLIGGGSRDLLSSALHGCGHLAGLHGLTDKRQRRTIFVPSHTLNRLLGITREGQMRNALVLIRNGHVHYVWRSDGHGEAPHNWTTILSMIG